MTWLLFLPILIPLSGAALGLILGGRAQTVFCLIGNAAHVLVSTLILGLVSRHGIMTSQAGNWPAPFGITLVADHLSALLLFSTSLLGLCCSVYSVAEISTERRSADYFPLFQALLIGISGALLAGDVFNLYVWFEVMVISSLVLLTLGRGQRVVRAAVPYVAINIIGSSFFLLAVGMLYGQTGSLNFAMLARQIQAMSTSGPSTVVAMLFLVAFGVKSALFPLFFWLPESYHTPPVAVSAAFSGMFTKVGVYALFRVFTLLFIKDVSFTHSLILYISVVTMVVGVLGAVSQLEFRKLLSFHIVSQIGYMTFGLALFTQNGIAGAIFFVVHNIFTKSNLFLISGVVASQGGTFELKKLGGLYKTSPGLSIAFLVSALSLAGLPPLPGFWGKLALAREGFRTEQFVAAFASLGVGFLTLYSMMKIWTEAFWKPNPSTIGKATGKNEARLPRIAPIMVLLGFILAIGIFPDFLMSLSRQAARELLDPAIYIQAVLGETG